MAKPWSDPGFLTSEAERARQVYLDSLDPHESRARWHETLDRVVAEFQDQLESAFSHGRLQQTLEASGQVMALLRQLTAPPLSQDQFKLLCPNWPKSSEKLGTPIRARDAAHIAATLTGWLDPRILAGIRAGRAVEVAAGPIYILARQRFETERRTAVARQQEAEVMCLLRDAGFTKQQSREIDKPWTVGSPNFMHCTTFSATRDSTAEVDLAIGLPAGRMLAIECKVSNDATNSIKRINDVLKKREAWARAYGEVLTTGAVLQGVIASKDIRRLAAAGVCVFFSHRLETLRQYLSEQC